MTLKADYKSVVKWAAKDLGVTIILGTALGSVLAYWMLRQLGWQQ